MTHATGKPSEHVRTPITGDISHLSEGDKKACKLLAQAFKFINAIYLIQSGQSMHKTKGAFDKSRAGNHYPSDLSKEAFEEHLKKNPLDRDAFVSPFTLIQRSGNVPRAIPYSEYYKTLLAHVIDLLNEAAQHTTSKTLATFLMSRAQAFRDNNYWQSDIDWVNVTGAPLELTIGPYEEYGDKLLGIKRDFQGLLGVVLPDETAHAQMYQKHIGEFDAHLGKRYGYTAATTLTPMVVVDELVASGILLYGYIAMAYNLPNDEDFQQEIGTKKVFVRNVMNAKMELITRRIAERVLDPHIASLLTPSVFMNFVIGHESSHGLSFRFEGKDFEMLGSPLEEGKADVFGMIFLYYLAQKGVINKDIAERAVIGNLTDGLRQMRFGINEAHSVGTLIQYNWFLTHGAMRFGGNGLEFVPQLFEQVLDGLGQAFYELANARDKNVAHAFVSNWANVPEEVREMIASFDGIPVDIDPVFDPIRL